MVDSLEIRRGAAPRSAFVQNRLLLDFVAQGFGGLFEQIAMSTHFLLCTMLATTKMMRIIMRIHMLKMMTTILMVRLIIKYDLAHCVVNNDDGVHDADVPCSLIGCVSDLAGVATSPSPVLVQNRFKLYVTKLYSPLCQFYVNVDVLCCFGIVVVVAMSLTVRLGRVQ